MRWNPPSAVEITAGIHRWPPQLVSITGSQRWVRSDQRWRPSSDVYNRWELSLGSITRIHLWGSALGTIQDALETFQRWKLPLGEIIIARSRPSRRLSAGQEAGQTLSSVRYKLQEDESNETARSGGEKIH